MSNIYNRSFLNEQEIIDLVIKAASKRTIIDMDCCNIIIIINPDMVYWDSNGLIGDSLKINRIISTIIKNCGSLELIPCKSNDCLAATIAQGITENYLKLSAEMSDRIYEDAKRTLLNALYCDGVLSTLSTNNFIDENNVQANAIRRYYGHYCC
jgi:hypothetical protein